MSKISFEGIVEQGQIKLPPNIQFPEKTKIHVVLSDAKLQSTAHIFSPRLANPAQAKDFVLEITEAVE